MIRTSLLHFLKPQSFSFHYCKSFAEVRSHIQQTLNSKNYLWSEKDVMGEFSSEYSFTMWLISPILIIPAYGKPNSLLQGNIITSGNETTINCVIRTRFRALFVFYIFMIIGVISTVIGIWHMKMEEILLGLIFSTVAPGLCVLLGNAQHAGLKKRYLFYIDKPLAVSPAT